MTLVPVPCGPVPVPLPFRSSDKPRRVLAALFPCAALLFGIMIWASPAPGQDRSAQLPSKQEQQAQDQPGQERIAVDVELILMSDVSGSVDDEEFILQRRGYAEALRNPRVLAAIRSGPRGQIALSYVEWSGPFLQFPVIDWQLVSGAEDLESIAGRLETRPRAIRGGGTAVGHAIDYAMQSILGNGYQGTRQVIDVSGDGPDNRGSLPASVARDRAVAAGMTINGLPILDGTHPMLEFFFLDDVIGGPGAFSIPARGFHDFSAAILAKLIREIAGMDGLDPDQSDPDRSNRSQAALRP